jgi:hypothetical protein
MNIIHQDTTATQTICEKPLSRKKLRQLMPHNKELTAHTLQVEFKRPHHPLIGRINEIAGYDPMGLFLEALTALGGEYKIERDFRDPKKHTGGRKQPLPIYDITRKVNGVKRYAYDQRGQLRSLSA